MTPRYRLVIYLFAAAFIAFGAHAGDWLAGDVPLPDDAAAQPPPAGIPADLGRFLGLWTGSWDGRFHHILIVERVGSDGTADVVYAVADYRPANISRAWSRVKASIAGDTLTIQGRASINYTFEPSGTLFATWRRGASISSARMKPASVAMARDRSADLAWSEPSSIFVDGPAENGAVSKLEVVLFRPPGTGPFRLAVFNHGSTGNGRDPAFFAVTNWDYAVADDLVSRGWLVAFPQRRGRGRSSGLYDEGFAANRAQGYTGEPEISLRGAERALTDIDAAVAALRRRPDVAPGPVLMGGVSRGGVLSVVFAGRHPELVSGVINFVGGWLGTGFATAAQVNGTLFREGGRYTRPTLWLYGDNDRHYSLEHSRANFDAFRAAGGQGEFLDFAVPNGVGHMVSAFRELWLTPVETYLKSVVDAQAR